MVVTVFAAKPDSWRWRKKEIAKLGDIWAGFSSFMNLANFLKAELYWRMVDSALSASVKSMLTGSILCLLFAANFIKSIKSEFSLFLMNLRQSELALSGRELVLVLSLVIV